MIDSKKTSTSSVVMAAQTIFWMIIRLQNLGIPSSVIQKMEAGLANLEKFASRLPEYDQVTEGIRQIVNIFHQGIIPIKDIDPDKLWVQKGNPEEMLIYLQLIKFSLNGLIKLSEDFPLGIIDQFAEATEELGTWYKQLTSNSPVGTAIDALFSPQTPDS
ncbi:MAG: hypothetical protein WC508_00165 [Patescibacteria group bacterium]